MSNELHPKIKKQKMLMELALTHLERIETLKFYFDGVTEDPLYKTALRVTEKEYQNTMLELAENMLEIAKIDY